MHFSLVYQNQQVRAKDLPPGTGWRLGREAIFSPAAKPAWIWPCPCPNSSGPYPETRQKAQKKHNSECKVTENSAPVTAADCHSGYSNLPRMCPFHWWLWLVGWLVLLEYTCTLLQQGEMVNHRWSAKTRFSGGVKLLFKQIRNSKLTLAKSKAYL